LHKNFVELSGGNSLYLSSDFQDYIASFRRIARENGFKPKTPVIDLTGRSPGTVYILGGTAPGAAWLLGGYPGSQAFVRSALKFVSCQELASSWIITEPDLSYQVPSGTLNHVGIDIEQGYLDLGTVTSPTPPFNAQHLLLPKDPERTIEKCESARNLQDSVNSEKAEISK
ncbi:MAG: hypothetical protein K2X47_02915, partial [Bdellovibrionales bacterium]|nr:hypothetical protein [Bdellovibrionales bacterium]